MNITYTNIKKFSCEQLHDLFLSVEWLSANYPERLFQAMQNSSTVITAWDDDKLIGLASAIDDGVLTAYVPYLLIDPNYQHMGIGKQLLRNIKAKYKDYLYLLLISEKESLINFYESEGFTIPKNTFAMVIENI